MSTADVKARSYRKEHFYVRVEPTRDPLFEGEQTMFVSYNGRQEYPTTLAPYEALRLVNVVSSAFGFPAPGYGHRSKMGRIDAIRPLRTKEDHAAALAEVESLMGAIEGTAEADRLGVLAVLVEAYEREHFPLPAGPADWRECERIANLPDVHETLRGFSDDPTGDNGTNVVRAVLAAVRSKA